MTSNNFKILPCDLSDMSECVDIFEEAFASDHLMVYLHGHCDPNVLKEHSLKKYEKSYMAPGIKYFKAVDEKTGEIAAYSKWVYPHTPDPNAEDPEAAIRNEPQVPGTNVELAIELYIKFLRGRQKWVVPETHYFMNVLGVRPKYQRQGLGSMLLAPVLELVDKDNAKAYVQASPKGLGLYVKHGWVEVDEILMDCTAYGGDSKAKTTLMIREPRSNRGV